MKRFLSHLAALLMALAFVLDPAMAGPGHDHGDEAPVSPSGPASPRFEAHSDLFEVVGVFDGHGLSVLVDRYADNEPVLNAKVELESGDAKASGEFHEDSGEYRFTVNAFEKAGSHPVTLTVTAGNDIDILAANLVIPEAHDDHGDHGHAGSESLHERFGAALAALAAAFVIALLALAVRRFMKRRSTGGSR
jgi:hypothetical protein